MKGFIRNRTPVYAHALKRSIGPNQTIPLDDIYAQYGEKHNLSEGEEFVNWLKTVKLRDANRWQIVYEADAQSDTDNTANNITEEDNGADTVTKMVNKTLGQDELKEKQQVVEIKNRGNNVLTVVPNKMDVKDVVGLSVRQAREIVPKITDFNLLKYSIQEANQLAGKDSLCLILRKRIKQLELYR